MASLNKSAAIRYYFNRQVFWLRVLIRPVSFFDDRVTGQEILHPQHVRACPVNDRQQCIHRRDLFELFGHKPAQEILANVIVL
jgi:hypothetical protein